jgi:hypothetical protein
LICIKMSDQDPGGSPKQANLRRLPMPACSACGLDSPPGKKFCGACGAALQADVSKDAAPPAITGTLACTNCGRAAPATAKFCRYCGTAIAGKQHETTVTSAPAPQPHTLSDPTTILSATASPSATNSRTIWLAALASVAVLIALGSWWFVRGRNASEPPRQATVQPPAPVVPQNQANAGVEPAEVAAAEQDNARLVEQQRLVEIERAEALAQQRVEDARREADRIKREAQLEAEERQRALAQEAELRQLEVQREQERLRAEREARARAEAEQRKAEEQLRQDQAAEAGALLSSLPARTELDVRLSTTLNSGRAKVEDRFEATTTEHVVVNGRTVIPAGSMMRGVVASLQPATRTNRTARMTLNFDQLIVAGNAYPIRGTVTRLLEGPGLKGETRRIATGSAVGAIIGGILGGAKGAIAGLGIGAGGTIAATEGKEIDLSEGSILRVRIDSVQSR